MFVVHPPADILARLAFWGVLLNLTALTVSLWVCRRSLAAVLAEPGKPVWAGLLILMAAGTVFQVMTIAPKHLVYLDEQWYLEAAKNLLLRGFAPGFSKALGWPVLVAGSYILMGLGNYSAIYTGMAIGTVSIAVLFVLAWVMTRCSACALFAAALWTFLPARLVWSATAETAVPALTFMLGALCLWRRCCDTGNRYELWSGILAWGMAVQIRPEAGMFLVLFVVSVWLWRHAESRKILAAGLGRAAATALLVLPNLLIYYRFMSARDWMAVDSGGLAQGSNLGLGNMVRNTFELLPRFWDGSMHPAALSLAAAAGFVYLVWRRRRDAAFLAAWAGLLYAFYFGSNLDFYGGTTDLFPKTKLLLHFGPVLVLTASCGFCAAYWERWGRAAQVGVLSLAAALVWGWPASLASWPLRNDSRELETRMLADLGRLVPEGCMLVAAAPTMAGAANRLPVVAANDFLVAGPLRPVVSAGTRCVLFLDDLSCRLGLPDLARTCVAMKRRFSLEPFIHFSQGASRYTLYTIKPLPQAGTAKQ